jgi:hypothetical protein
VPNGTALNTALNTAMRVRVGATVLHCWLVLLLMQVMYLDLGSAKADLEFPSSI